MMNKPFSQACENNKRPILNVLTKVFSKTEHVLEIGSGTGNMRFSSVSTYPT